MTRKQPNPNQQHTNGALPEWFFYNLMEMISRVLANVSEILKTNGRKMAYSLGNPQRPKTDALLVVIMALAVLFSNGATIRAAPQWSAKLDGQIRFYQTTEFGVIVCSTEKSLYALDGESGAILWGRRHSRLDQTDVAPVPGTDILLLSLVNGSKSWLEALDLISGETLWRSDKVRGAVMQLALDTNAGLLAVVLAREARGKAHDGIKRKPVVQVFELRHWQRRLEA